MFDSSIFFKNVGPEKMVRNLSGSLYITDHIFCKECSGSVVLIDFWLTVKAATQIFISGRGSAISSSKQGNQVLFIIW